jgi:hypothetical protein
MKKIGLFSLLLFFIGVIISGCGSNTKADPIPVSPYLFTNASTPLQVADGGEAYPLRVQLLKNGSGFSGQNVTMMPFDSRYGLVVPSAVVTDASGWAEFSYTSPESLAQINGQSATLHAMYDDGNGSVIVQDFVLNFNRSQYSFINATTPVNITAPSQAKVIAVTLVKENNIGVPGEVVTISPLPSSIYGTIDPISTTTDASGKASFSYVAPSKLTGLGTVPLTISFTKNGQTITQNIQIVFEKSNYRFVNVTTPIVINNGSQTAEISAYLVDKDNIGVSGKSVTISPVATGYGTVTPGADTTDAAGKAVFTYTAPLHLTGLTNTNLTLSYTDNIGTVSANVEIRIVSGGDTGYQLVNAKDPYYIYSPTQPDTFDIQLIKNGLPVLDARPCTTATSTVAVDCVIPDAIDRRFGRFQGIASSDNAEDGYTYYTYLAPADSEKAANGEDTTFIVLYIDKQGMIAAQSEPILLRMRY